MTQTPSRQRPGGPVATEPSLVQRLVAGGYDRLFDRVDPLGGGDHRRRLVEQAAGEVLEIGAGTGRNLPLYRTATRVVALEPGPGMRARAHQAARTAQVAVEVVDGTAEALPFPEAAFDTVVASLGLAGRRLPSHRDVVAAITAAGFRLLELDGFDFQIMPPVVRPHVLGVAQRPTHPGSAQQVEEMNQARGTSS